MGKINKQLTNNDNMLLLLEKKAQRLIEELNKINKEAEDGGDYQYLSNRYIWKLRILKDTESRITDLLP